MYHDRMNTSKFKTFIFSKTAFVLSLVLLVIVARAAWSVNNKARDTRDNLALVEAELAELHERGEYLEGEISYLQTEEGVEAEIRDKFNVVRDGEEVIVIVNENKETDTPKSVEEEKQTLFQKIGKLFKRK